MAHDPQPARRPDPGGLDPAEVEAEIEAAVAEVLEKVSAPPAGAGR
jgi:hypothetical protein